MRSQPERGPEPDESTDEEDGARSSMTELLRELAFSPRLPPPGSERARVGQALGRFRITGLLGRGGMGVVYAAADPTLRRDVALKLLPEEAAPDEERRRRLLREARSAAAVSHPNIAAVFEVGEIGGEVFIAMERVVGRSLRAVMQEAGGALPAEEAGRVAREIARGLAAAHEAGVIHRDVKPENVMLGEGGAVKLLDFGLAKLRAPEGGGAAQGGSELSTREGRILGTPSYMAPEQARGLPADARSDVFALGVVLYEMLAGERPFQGETTADVLAAILRDEAPPLSGRGVSEALAGVVARCLEKEPGARYAHAGELLAALEAAANARPRRRGRARLAVAAAVTAAIAVTVAVTVAVTAAVTVTAPAAATVSATVAAPRPTAITDQPIPESSSPAAIAAYRAALQAFRDANWGRAELDLREALEHDPTLAAAHLRLALIMSNLDFVSAEGQAAYAEATRRRGSLTPRDRALLDALEPLLIADPADLSEAARRLTELSRAYPHDAEIFNLIAVYRRLDAPALRLVAGLHATQLDPDYADPWQQVGGALADTDPEGADAALERCTTIAPTASDCWSDRAGIAAALGRCEAAEGHARRATSDPRSSSYHRQMRAHLLHGLGKPAEVVAEALRQKWTRLAPSSEPEVEELHDRALLAAAYGDFDEARARAVEGLRRTEAAPTLRWQARFSRLLADVELEAGRPEAAAAAASSYLARRDAWQLGLPTEDPAVYLARIAARGGALPEAEVRARRDAWYRAATAGSITSAQRAEAWTLAYALGVEREDEAAEALAARPAGARWSMLNASVDAALGRALWLGGRRDEAMPHLARASARCDRLASILVLTRTSLLHGRALEERGERGGACEVYGAVLGQWGKARPRSVTAEEARRRARALGCEGAGE